MSVGDSVRKAVEGITTRMAANWDSVRDLVEAPAGVDLQSLIGGAERLKYEAAEDFGGERLLPRLYVIVEGSVEIDDFLTPARDLSVPLLLRLVHREHGAETVEDYSWGYAEILRRLLNEHGEEWANDKIWRIVLEDLAVDAHGDDRYRRQVELRATVKVRTDRTL